MLENRFTYQKESDGTVNFYTDVRLSDIKDRLYDYECLGYTPRELRRMISPKNDENIKRGDSIYILTSEAAVCQITVADVTSIVNGYLYATDGIERFMVAVREENKTWFKTLSGALKYSMGIC